MDNREKKSRAYLALQFHQIPWYAYGIAAASGIGSALLLNLAVQSMSGLVYELFVLGLWSVVLTVGILVIPYVDRICAVTLYQKEAYFYQSFPVSSLQTVLAKTLVSGILLCTVPAGFILTEACFLEQRGIAFLTAALALCGALGFLAAGIILTGYRIGNNFRNQKQNRPNKVVSYIFIVAVTVLLFFLWKLIYRIQVLSFEGKLFAAAAGFAALGLLFFGINVNAIKRSYEV